MPTLDAANIAFNLLKTALGDGVVTVGPILLGARALWCGAHPDAVGDGAARIVNMTRGEAAPGVSSATARCARSPRSARRCTWAPIACSSSAPDGRRFDQARVRSNLYPSLAQIAGHALNSIFLDSLAVDIERLERINRTVSLIPEAALREAGVTLRPVKVLFMTPSQPIERIAARFLHDLPRAVRFVLRPTGALARSGSNLASYLLFEESFCRALIDLGYQDTHGARGRGQGFLSRTLRVSMADSKGPQDPFETFRQLWGPLGLPVPGMAMPTLDPKEVDKRLAELRSVEAWLQVNLNMVRFAVQGLELQRSALLAMGAGAEPGAPPSAFAELAARGANTMMWPWAVMQQVMSGQSPPAPPPPEGEKQEPNEK
jgi:hypothetical protein